jgi:hypothetical protein
VNYEYRISTDARCAVTGPDGIPARAGDKPGSAEVQLCDFNGDRLTAAGRALAFNFCDSPIGPTRYVVVLPVQGCWVVVSEECSPATTTK